MEDQEQKELKELQQEIDTLEESTQEDEIIEAADLEQEKEEEKESEPEEPKKEETCEDRLTKQCRQEDKMQEEKQARYDALSDADMAGKQLGLSNTELHFEQHIKFKYDSESEQKMKDLEKQDKENQTAYLTSHYLDFRQKEYQAIDGLFREALAEEICEDKTDKMDEYKKQRAAIKTKYPKPEDK